MFSWPKSSKERASNSLELALGGSSHQENSYIKLHPTRLNGWNIPSRKLTYPTWGKGKSSSNNALSGGIC